MIFHNELTASTENIGCFVFFSHLTFFDIGSWSQPIKSQNKWMWKQSLTFTSMIVIYLLLYSTSHSFNHYQSHLKLLLNIIFDCVHPTTQRAPDTITVPQHQQTASYRLSRHLFFCGTSKSEATTRPFYQINIFLGDLNISSTTGFFLFLLFSSKKK